MTTTPHHNLTSSVRGLDALTSPLPRESGGAGFDTSGVESRHAGKKRSGVTSKPVTPPSQAGVAPGLVSFSNHREPRTRPASGFPARFYDTALRGGWSASLAFLPTPRGIHKSALSSPHGAAGRIPVAPH